MYQLVELRRPKGLDHRRVDLRVIDVGIDDRHDDHWCVLEPFVAAQLPQGLCASCPGLPMPSSIGDLAPCPLGPN